MEHLFGVPELLVMIYKELKFADQLSLAQVHSSLSSIFANFIVRVKYEKLKLRKLHEMEDFVVSNNKDEDSMLLTYDEAENLLKFGCEKVMELHVSLNIWESDRFCMWSWGNLRNLTCLYFKRTVVSEKDLLLVAANCAKLSELGLFRCKNEDGGFLVIGQGISILTLQQMKNLKRLQIRGPGKPIGMSLFCDLVTTVPLEYIKLNAILKQDVHSKLNERPMQQHLKELEIDFDSEALQFLESTGVLKSLVKLRLNMNDVTDSDLQTIARACENLECLSLCPTSACSITQFLMPPSIKELYIFAYQGLKHTHVVEALTKYKIEKFKCIWFWDWLEDFKISAHIKVLDLDGVNMLQFPSSYSNNNTLMELHWYEHNQYSQDGIENREYLKTCINLECLIIHCGFVPLQVILELKNLQKLQILRSFEKITWSYIVGLLNHPSLKELHVDDGNAALEDDANIPEQGFPSTITLVNITFEVLEKSLHFWLDMLQENHNMAISCGKFDLWLLEELIYNDFFPEDLREIKVWGFKLNCKDLRENFRANINKLQYFKEDFHQNKTLILSWKLK